MKKSRKIDQGEMMKGEPFSVVEPAYADKYIDLHLHLDGAFTTDEVKAQLKEELGLPD